MSTPTECLVCDPPRRFETTEAFVKHYESRFDHYEVSGTYEREYLDHLQEEHLEDAK
jgi:hypothetical protein